MFEAQANTRPVRRAVLLTALLALAACAGSGNPNQDTVEGTLHVCSSCHGQDGRSESPTFPRLAGQQREYLVAQLKAFRDHTRADPHAHTYMWGMAARLSDTTIDGVADFYSKQTPAKGSGGDTAEMAAGQKIYGDGIPARDVPACVACHGEKAEGAGAIPRIAGQHRTYLEGQLEAFSANTRANEIMHENTKNLTAEEARQLAAYLSAQ